MALVPGNKTITGNLYSNIMIKEDHFYLRAPRRRLRCSRHAQNQPLSMKIRAGLELCRGHINFIRTTLYTELPDTHPRGVRLFTCQRATNSRINLHTSPITFVIAGVNFQPFRKTWLRQGRRNSSDHSTRVNLSPNTKQLATSSTVHQARKPMLPAIGTAQTKPHHRKIRWYTLATGNKKARQLDCQHFKKSVANRNVRPKPSNRCSSVTAADPGRW